MKETDKYIKLVEWSEEDNCYVGSIPGWIGKCCHGNDELQVYKELNKILEEWINIYNNDNRKLPEPTNKKYSGKLVFRTDSETHKILSLRAANEGISLNNYLNKKLKNMVK
ncbi:MAG: toxin-antitoxin system HicB family antitoxin [Melioribacteraceae bacterium]|nr:MAG: toxin-antitoxin system HicB family antitoxin [Melioribacteraceae bacterium]